MASSTPSRIPVPTLAAQLGENVHAFRNANASLLVVDPSLTDDAVASLGSAFHVTVVASEAAALRSLSVNRASVVVTELALPDGSGVSICREAKLLADPPAVLVTTAAVNDVPGALMAGCDGVLVKPFAVNLLHSRLARLLRQRAQQMQRKACLEQLRVAHQSERFEALEAGSNRTWANEYCPACSHGDAVSFDAAVHRQMWFACLTCRHVWVAPRREL